MSCVTPYASPCGLCDAAPPQAHSSLGCRSITAGCPRPRQPASPAAQRADLDDTKLSQRLVHAHLLDVSISGLISPFFLGSLVSSAEEPVKTNKPLGLDRISGSRSTTSAKHVIRRIRRESSP